jgi:hypothetical protein
MRYNRHEIYSVTLPEINWVLSILNVRIHDIYELYRARGVAHEYEDIWYFVSRGLYQHIPGERLISLIMRKMPSATYQRISDFVESHIPEPARAVLAIEGVCLYVAAFKSLLIVTPDAKILSSPNHSRIMRRPRGERIEGYVASVPTDIGMSLYMRGAPVYAKYSNYGIGDVHTTMPALAPSRGAFRVHRISASGVSSYFADGILAYLCQQARDLANDRDAVVPVMIHTREFSALSWFVDHTMHFSIRSPVRNSAVSQDRSATSFVA